MCIEIECYSIGLKRTAPYIADLFGRKIGVAIGIVVLVIGAIIQGTNALEGLQN
jgi:hypothetical protein